MKNLYENQENIVVKKPYCTPELTTFGSIEQLTLGSSSSTNSDSGNDMMAAPS